MWYTRCCSVVQKRKHQVLIQKTAVLLLEQKNTFFFLLAPNKNFFGVFFSEQHQVLFCCSVVQKRKHQFLFCFSVLVFKARIEGVLLKNSKKTPKQHFFSLNSTVSCCVLFFLFLKQTLLFLKQINKRFAFFFCFFCPKQKNKNF